jgi:hypothetical protein
MRHLSPLLSIFLIPLLVTGPAWTQTASLPGSPVSSLEIRPLSLQSKEAAVLVTDSNGKPVSNAAVVFRLSEDATSGKFADGSYAFVAYSDESGKAVSSVIQTAGSAATPLRVTAAKGSAHAGALFAYQPVSSQPVIAAAPPAAPKITISTPTITPVKQEIAIARPAAPVAEPDAEIERPAAPRVSIQNFGGKSHPSAPGRLAANSEALPRPVATENDPNENVPLRSSFGSSSSMDSPGVSITSSSMAPTGGHSKAKWLTIIAVAAGAGAALAFAHPGGGGAASGVSVGAPTVSVGHP